MSSPAPPRPSRIWNSRVGAFQLAFLLLVIGIIVGTLRDDVPERPVVMRAGLRVIEADFHAHTRFSDGFLSPFDLVLQARRRRLDALAITDHNLVFPAQLGAWFSRLIGGPTIVVGEEITTTRYHVHGLGLQHRVDASMSLDRVIDDVHAQGGVVIAAHPVGLFWPSLVPARPRMDGSEVMHPIALGSARNRFSWRWEEMRRYYLDARATGQPFTAIGSSDYHFFSPLGVCRTLVFVERNDAASILAALHAGRTVVYDLEGRAYGDAALIDALQRDPYPLYAQDYDYRGNGALDRIGRTAGFLGVLGLILFSPRRRRRAGLAE